MRVMTLQIQKLGATCALVTSVEYSFFPLEKRWLSSVGNSYELSLRIVPDEEASPPDTQGIEKFAKYTKRQI